ncbi:isochorismate synthase [Companilactobacillus zhongbaensis]|uniref:isochorismate synthase n=1 Tax=Companilactobacillus zhongbaensis TaxID=2486009 RepID=UPI000F7BADFC|nr:isochorismate synthase [Companilactobacillus zhongbaensis]
MLNVRQIKTTFNDERIESLLKVALKQEIFSFFESADGSTQWVGIGSTDKITPSAGADRFNQVETWFNQIKKKLPQKTDMDSVAILGGFSFDEVTKDRLFADWTNGIFILPRLIFKIEGNQVSITEIKKHSFTDVSLSETIEQLISLSVEHTGLTKVSLTDLDPDWAKQVDRLAKKIRDSQTLQKVVLGRFKKGLITGTIDPVLALKALRSLNKTTYHFFIKFREQMFISSTPERLFKLTGKQLSTAAVAGTIRRGSDNNEDNQLALELFKDSKNRQEHEIVVKQITDKITPLAEDIHQDDMPMILKNQTVQHLYTPITATLKNTVDVFSLIEQMHPTPALGGLPKEAAMSIIQEEESQSRGLFGAPIGYISFDGDSEMIVGIRSLYLNQATVLMFAGAGIMPDSIGKSEQEETELKFQPMIQLLKYLEDK